MKPSIFEVARRLERFPLKHQADHLQNLIQLEPLRSVRRIELVAALRRVVLRDLKAGNRGLKRKAS